MATKAKMPKHGKQFARLYIQNGRNGTAAARELPGINTENSAAVLASKLLRNDKVQAEIARLEKKLEEKTLDITKDRILKELAILGFADMKDYVTIGEEGQVTLKTFEEMPEGASRAISKVEEIRRIMGAGKGDGGEIVLEIRTRYGHHDKLGALKEIAKLKGFYPEEGTGEAKQIVYVFGSEKG